MARALSPFGLRPYGGKQFRTTTCMLNSTHVVIGKGDLIYEVDGGCVPLRNDTVTGQVGIVGVSTQNLAANTGGYLEVWPFDIDSQFFGQAGELASTYGLNPAVGNQFVNINTNTVVNTATGESTNYITTTNTPAAANSPVYIKYYAPIPNNTPNAADVYPIFVVSPNPSSTKFARGI
jgi:hypothetical protein